MHQAFLVVETCGFGFSFHSTLGFEGRFYFNMFERYHIEFFSAGFVLGPFFFFFYELKKKSFFLFQEIFGFRIFSSLKLFGYTFVSKNFSFLSCFCRFIKRFSGWNFWL